MGGGELAIAERPRDGRVLQVPRDFASVQAAVLAARDGDCVALSSGMHELQEPLCIDRDIHLIAGDEGSGGVVLRLDVGKSKLLRAATHMVTVDCGSCRLGHIALEHIGGEGDPSLDGELVFAIWCRRGSVLIDQCRIRAAVHSGIGASAESQPTVSRCSVDAREYGLWVEPGAQLGARVDKCRFIRPRRGVYFSDRSVGEVENSEFDGCGVGVECQQLTDAVLGGNSFRGCTEAGVYCCGGVALDDAPTVRVYGNEFDGGCDRGLVADASRPEATKNSFSGCTRCAIDVTGGARGRFVSNTVEGGAIGARVSQQSNPLFRRNTFDSCTSVGVSVSGARSLANFVANTFDACVVGVEVRDHANPTVVSNVVRGSDTALLFADEGLGRVRSNEVTECAKGCALESGANPVIDQNEITQCGTAVIVNGAQGVLMQNEVVGCEDAAVQLIGSKGTVLEENTIRDGAQEGVLATHAAHALLRGNTVRGNKVAPVQCSEDSRAHVTLEGNTLKGVVTALD